MNTAVSSPPKQAPVPPAMRERRLGRRGRLGVLTGQIYPATSNLIRAASDQPGCSSRKAQASAGRVPSPPEAFGVAGMLRSRSSERRPGFLEASGADERVVAARLAGARVEQ